MVKNLDFSFSQGSFANIFQEMCMIFLFYLMTEWSG